MGKTLDMFAKVGVGHSFILVHKGVFYNGADMKSWWYRNLHKYANG